MAKKLIFQKSGGNNISIDEEGLAANLWTEATFSDFGRYTPVFFVDKLYMNTTGTFVTPSSTTPITTPATDTLNWSEIGTGSGGSGNIQTITVDDGTGIVTITYNDGTTTETFNVGHQLRDNGTLLTHRDTINYTGTLNAVDNSAANRTDVFGLLIKPGSAGDANLVIEGNVENNEPVTVIRRVSGTANQITVTPGTGVTIADSTPIVLSSALGDVVLTDIKNKDVLEYDTASTMWVNKTLPNGLVERLEDLEDVEIIGDADDKILVARGKAAYFQVNPTSIGDTIYSIDTSGGLMFTKPGGSTPLINSVSVAFATSRSGNTTSYLIVDETGGDQLLVEMSFTAASITIEQFIDRIVLALQTNWSDGTGTSTERTVSDQMAGSTLVGMNGTWSKAENPNFVRGEKASGTTSEFSIPPGAPPVNDAVAIRWNISGRPTGYIQGVTDTFTGLGNTPTVIELLDTGVAALNDPNNPGGFNQNFPPNYLATRVGNSIRVTSTIDGSQSNGILTLEFVDSATGASNASDYIGNEGTTTITGGISGSGQPFSFRWTDSSHKHIIARPTLEAGGSATTTFSQGGFAWIDELPTLDLLSDVNINLPNPISSGQLQMLRSDFFGNFDNVDARVENLNVNNGLIPNPLIPTDPPKDAKVQGALLQYAPAGVGEWIWSGLKADGDGDFVLPPTQGEFLRFNQTGGVGEAWEASTAALNDLTDVDTVTKAPVEGEILKYVSGEWVPAKEITSSTAYFGLPTSTQESNPPVSTGFLGLLAFGKSPSYEVATDRTSLKVLQAGSYVIFGTIVITVETGTTGLEIDLALEVTRGGSVIDQLATASVVLGDGTTDPTFADITLTTLGEVDLQADDLIQIRFATDPNLAWNYAAKQGTTDLMTVGRVD